jgi:hypothetical protein
MGRSEAKHRAAGDAGTQLSKHGNEAFFDLPDSVAWRFVVVGGVKTSWNCGTFLVRTAVLRMRQTDSLALLPVNGEFEGAALIFVLIRLNCLGADAT